MIKQLADDYLLLPLELMIQTAEQLSDVHQVGNPLFICGPFERHLPSVMLLCLALVCYRQRMWFCEGVPLRIPGTTCGLCCGCLQAVVCCCCILPHRICVWAVVILGRLCWLFVPACDSERIWPAVGGPERILHVRNFFFFYYYLRHPDLITQLKNTFPQLIHLTSWW